MYFVYKSVKMSQSKRLLCYPWSIVKNIGSWDLKFLKKKVCILFKKKMSQHFLGLNYSIIWLVCIYIYIYMQNKVNQIMSSSVWIPPVNPLLCFEVYPFGQLYVAEFSSCLDTNHYCC